MDIEAKHFKNMLKDYQYYFEKVEKARLNVIEKETILGVHSIGYGDSVGTTNMNAKEINRINQLNALDIAQKKLKDAKKELNTIDRFIRTSEYGESCKLIYCLEQSTISKEAKKHCLSEKALKLNIDKSIEIYLKDYPQAPM